MNRVSLSVLTALVLAMLASAAKPAGAQNVGNCVVVMGFGQALEFEARSQCDFGEPMITITGQVEVTRQEADMALVSCWVCEQGSCDGSGPYGPAKVRMELDGTPDTPEVLAWETVFHFNHDALDGAPFPTFESYFCELSVAALTMAGRGGVAPMDFTVPDPFAPDARARPVEGAPLIVQLQGRFSEPVSGTRRGGGGAP